MGAAVSGVNGQIKHGYHVAAEVNGYTVACSPEKAWSLRATVAHADAFRLAQRPLVFVAPFKRVWNDELKRWIGEDGEWRWPIDTLDVQGVTVTANLGQPLTA